VGKGGRADGEGEGWEGSGGEGREEWEGEGGKGREREEGREGRGKEGKGEGGKSVPANKNLRLHPWPTWWPT